MLKKLIMFTGLLGGSVLFSGQALAAADFGPCTPEGGTHIFSATINKTVSDTSKNTTGATFVDFDSWICPYISRHLLSLNPLLACCRRYSRGER